MSFFKKLGQMISNSLNRNKREREWGKLFWGQKPANPTNLIPLDPEDPWKT